MGFRARRSFSIAPGVRLNVSKSGIGASVGTRGARYTVHSSGRRTTSVGIPGTGVGYVDSRHAGRATHAGRASPRTPEPTPVPLPKPGWFAPKGEKALYKLIESGDFGVESFEAIAREHPDQWLAASTLAGLHRVAGNATDDATVAQLQEVFAYATPPEEDPFIVTYLATASKMTIGLAPGVTVALPFSRDLVGLALAEVLQDRGELDAAIDVVERVTPTPHAAVSLAELYSAAGRHDEVIDLTNNVDNVDDTTALLLVYRGIAFTEQQLYVAAREVFRDALRFRKRAAAIRHLAWRHRAEVYVREGKKAQARKDLERILADDATVDGVRERLDELSG